MRAAVVRVGGGQDEQDRSVWWIALVGTVLLLALNGCGLEESKQEAFAFPPLQTEVPLYELYISRCHPRHGAPHPRDAEMLGFTASAQWQVR